MERLYREYTEAEVQFALALRLQESGFDVYLERRFEIKGFGTTPRSKNPMYIRVDVLVVFNGEIKCVIEVKNGFGKRNIKNTRQYGKYKSLGYPFHFCLNESEIEAVVEKCVELYKL